MDKMMKDKMGMMDESGKGGMKMMSGAEAEQMCKDCADGDMNMEEHAGQQMPVHKRKAM